MKERSIVFSTDDIRAIREQRALLEQRAAGGWMTAQDPGEQAAAASSEIDDVRARIEIERGHDRGILVS